MSHFLDRLSFFSAPTESFSDGHGVTTGEDRTWEDAYRNRWAHDKIVRSTHGVNCTGSCSWKIYVKGGIVTWETQQTDYPRTRFDMPNHEPRGCSRGASYSWYLYSANRVKYPLVRGRLLKLWRAARATQDPVAAWASIVESDASRRDYQSIRGLGGFVRADWDEVNELIAAANVHTIKRHGPDRIIGFSPIPAMSMVSYAAGSRYLSLIGGVCMSFYDWYCDLPPASPQIWGEQTDVPESADWYNSTYIIAWGSNVPQTRTPDAHFFTEVRYKGAKTVAVTPDYSEVAKLADLWMHPKQGTDAAVAMAMGHVILKEFYFGGNGRPRSAYFDDYVRQGPLAALDAVEAATGERSVNVIGYCLGGTLLGATLALMQARGDDRINAATFFTAMLDFAEPGDLGVFIDEGQLKGIEQTMRQIALGADRASRLINQLLALARAESHSPTGMQRLDLRALSESVSRDWVAKAQNKSIDLGFESTPASVMVDGNPLLLSELLGNLIDNAIRYTPSGGTVTVRLNARADAARLEVEDNGMGIPATEQALVFERFYRVLGTESEGSGLGLAIVREIAELHHGSAQLVPSQTGALFSIVLPLARPASLNLAA